jgi:hypothetical protein
MSRGLISQALETSYIMLYYILSYITYYIMTDGQSASLSWCQVPIWDPQPIFHLLSFIVLKQLRVCSCGAPSLTRDRVCIFQFL